MPTPWGEGEEKEGEQAALTWKPAELEMCLLLCQCLRNMCVSSETAERLSDCGAIPPLLTVLRHAPPDVVVAARPGVLPSTRAEGRLP